MKTLNKILAILPANGAKTYIGILLGAIGYLLPDFPINEGHVEVIIKSAGAIIAIIGILHKYVKSRL
tara:strand:- start:236 stop:436 length:201 start_codon:yes stop_codon:yes gene_type:complete